jgi:uncharacterized protein (TIGR02596 family)
MNSRRGFSLVEILVVLGIAVVLLALALPAFLGQSKAANLRHGAEQLQGELLLARQQALALNSPHEVRFFAKAGAAGFTAYQTFRVESDGTQTAASKVRQLPENVVIPNEAELSPLLTESTMTGTQSGGAPAVAGWAYAAFQFRSSGELADVAAEKAFLTLVDAQKPRAPGALPDNYARVSVQPITGMVSVAQP